MGGGGGGEDTDVPDFFSESHLVSLYLATFIVPSISLVHLSKTDIHTLSAHLMISRFLFLIAQKGKRCKVLCP